MSLLTDLEAPVTVVEGAVVAAWDYLVPPAMKAELGQFANAIAANIAYDAKQLGAKAASLAQDDINQIWTVVKNAVAQELQGLATGQFEPTLSKIVSDLSSTAVKSVFPLMKTLGLSTLKTLVGAAASMAISGVVA